VCIFLELERLLALLQFRINLGGLAVYETIDHEIAVPPEVIIFVHVHVSKIVDGIQK